MIRLCWALVLLAVGCDPSPRDGADKSGVVRVAAAADLRFALDAVADEFRKAEPGIDLKINYGSSGNFHTQIVNGAPFDIFFSADIDYPRKLCDKGFADAASMFPYARGRVVVWVQNSSTLDLKQGMEVLKDPAVKRVAIANPAHAPYGRAAEAAMKKSGVHDAVSPKLVLGENIAQTAQFVESGNADAGIIALSLALAPAMRTKGRYFEIPADAHPPLEQAGVILTKAVDRSAADKFRAFVVGPQGKAVLKRFGFVLPGE